MKTQIVFCCNAALQCITSPELIPRTRDEMKPTSSFRTPAGSCWLLRRRGHVGNFPHREPSVDDEVVAVDVLGLVGRQVQRRPRDVLGLQHRAFHLVDVPLHDPPALVSGRLRVPLLQDAHHQRRGDVVGRDGVHPHARPRHLPRHSAHDPDNGELGDAVRVRRDASQHAGDAGHADDAAAAARRHDARRVLDARHDPADVDRHDGVEVGEVEGAERGPGRGAQDAGVVEHDVQLAVAGYGEVHGRGHLGLVGDVAAGVGRRVGAQIGRQGAAQVVLDVGEDDLGAVPDELLRRRPADSARPTGDQGHLPGQPLLGARGRGVAAVAAGQHRRGSALSPEDGLDRSEHLSDRSHLSLVSFAVSKRWLDR
uniref:Uncharacterized protein n=1 Tax=Avena sativa TaxID=4498 RepID=A0ACD5YSZ0_AVESA